MSLSFACLPSNHDFPFACLVDLICNVILLFFRERGSLQALQNNFPPELHRHSLGNSLSQAEIDTESGSLATWALLLFTPFGGGLVRIFLFRAKSEGVGLLSLSKIDSGSIKSSLSLSLDSLPVLLQLGPELDAMLAAACTTSSGDRDWT